MRRVESGSRHGLTLIEVLVSLAILLMSLVGLSYLMNAAGDRARETQIRTEAMLHAQSKMAEVMAGAVPTDGQSEQPVDEDSDFLWSMESEQGPADGLLSVTIKVSRSRGIGSPLSVSLQQLVLDPTRVGSTQDAPPTAASSTSSSPSGSSTTTSGSSSTSTTGQ